MMRDVRELAGTTPEQYRREHHVASIQSASAGPGWIGADSSRRTAVSRVACVVAIGGALISQLPAGGQDVMKLTKITPMLYVEDIEPSLPFWTERLGFQVTTEVPQDDRLGFVILERDGLELMMQTRASVEADVPVVAATPRGASILFIEVEALDPIVAALKNAPVVVPRRTAFYGADEIFVREPGGNIIGFAAFGSRE